MNKIFSLVACALLSCASAFADGEKPNALRLILNKGDGEKKEVLFTDAPKVNHKANGTVVLTVGADVTEYAQTDIEKMTFFYNNGTNSIINAFADGDKNAPLGIFTINGMKLERISEPGIYIINGKKVQVK